MTTSPASSSMKSTATPPGMPAPVLWTFRNVVNPVIKRLLRSRWHGRVSKAVMLISFTGRKSGRRLSTPVRYTREGDLVWFLTDMPWWKNLRGGAPVTLLLEGVETAGTAYAYPDPQRIAQLMQRDLAQQGQAYVEQRFRITLDSPQPGLEELTAKAQGKVLVEVHLAPQAVAVEE
jgi:hypothetical protein